METNVRTPLDVFNLPQHLVVPLFQRPYVWDETEQWLPLWQDVRRLTEIRLNDPFSSATHFLGAVVLQAQDNPTGNLPSRNVIDGQQRLTTLQLLMDATGSVLEEHALDNLSGQLEVLTHNLELYVTGGDTRLKLRHTSRDQAAFDEVMSAEPPILHETLKHAGALVARAHRFFAETASAWLAEAANESEIQSRATGLVQVLTRGLQLVVIDLQAQENSQEIFETLNARGTPLTAADLVKNFVFQRLDAEGVDTRRAYAEDWPFESKFWETEVSVGRYNISRSSLFLNQWLGSRTGEEVSPRSTFARFKHYADHQAQQPMSELLLVIRQQADLYEQWTTAAADPDRALDPAQMSTYCMQAAGIELLKPLLIWLHDPELAIPASVADEVISAAESWIMRRLMLRLTSADLGRVVAEIIRTHRTAPSAELGHRTRTHLMGLTSASNYWPGDKEVRSSLLTENAYGRFRRARLRVMLEAVEDQLRGKYGYPPVPRRGYHIEHVLPQKWETHWSVDGLEAELERGAHVHRLGNLTLLTRGLNSAVSNGAWEVKRAQMAKHDVFLMNRLFQNHHTETWDEEHIDQRSEEMINTLLATWPVPDGHVGTVQDSGTKDQMSWVELKHLVAAGLLEAGTRLVPRSGQWAQAVAIVRHDGRLEIDGQTFGTPSGAGKHVKGAVTNGWHFWRLEDGRRLADVRAAFRGDRPASEMSKAAFDWSGLHAILETMPAGTWTTYGDLADVVGTAPQPLGAHIMSCAQCANAHRVLSHDGRVNEAFKWSDPSDDRDPTQLLNAEGVRFADGKADHEQRITTVEMTELLESS